jgi:hypothetical protein
LIYTQEVLKNCLVRLLFIGLLTSTVWAKYSGGDGEPNNPYRIATVSDWNDLMHTSSDWNKCFIMTGDIDLQGVALTPVGNDVNQFKGVFNGNNHIIRNADINMPDSFYVGLFGLIATSGSQIRNLGAENIRITGGYCVGGLAGYRYQGSITDCYVAGTITGHDFVGGLVGYNQFGTIQSCHAAGSVSGHNTTGGLVGYNYQGPITDSYAADTVSGNNNDVGGLVADNVNSVITRCYTAGAVTGIDYVGGLVANNSSSSTITDCYAAGTVTGNRNVGGLTGNNSSTITDCYAIGYVTGTTRIGGLVGYSNNGTTIASFWDVNTSGQAASDGGTGKTTAEMQDVNIFLNAGWDFVGETANGYLDTWRMCINGLYYPKLSWQFPLGDFVCPDGVDWKDLLVLCNQWLLEELSADIDKDGIVNFFDYTDFANNWQGNMNDLADFTSQWLKSSAYCADIAPAPGGDGVVNFIDFAAFAENWLKAD